MGKTYKLAVLGGGPGGYVAAIRAADLGMPVCLIEQDALGGVCLQKGCIPTKTYLKSAVMFSELKTADKLGINLGQISFDLAVLRKRKQDIVKQLTQGIEFLLKQRKIEIIKGRGVFVDRSTLQVNGENVGFENCILAVGSAPAGIPGIAADPAKGIVYSDGMLDLEEVPRRLVIVGGGVIGCEFADIFSRLGAQVTIVDIAERILPQEDEEITRGLLQEFKQRGVKIMTGVGIKELKHSGDVKEILLSDQTILSADLVLLAVGRKPNIEGIGLREIGVKIEKSAVAVNEFLQTSIESIYAVGDINAKTFLAHAASHEGMLAAEHISGKTGKMNYSAVPRCIYTKPQIAGVGITEKYAREHDQPVKIGRFPFKASGRALIENQSGGMVKVISDARTGKLLGAGICGPEATEIIHVFAVAIRCGLGTDAIGEAVFAHPTFSESLGEALQAVSGQAIHFFNKDR